jgi:uncharacterized protein with PIN domain
MPDERIAVAEPAIVQCPWCNEVNRAGASPQLEMVEDGRGVIADIWLCNTCAKVFAAGDTRTRPQGDGDDGELDSVVEPIH